MKSLTISSAPDQQYLRQLENISFQPIFIMGDHRSGTTLFYSLLAATQCFNVVTAYHIIRYDQILSNFHNHREEDARQQLQAYFATMRQADRIIDEVEVTPDLPEEYGFLLSTTYKSPLNTDNLPRFIELCRKIQFVSTIDNPLLLKNPWDYFLNFMYVKRVFPSAKFLFIHRHPIDIVNSQLQAVRSTLSVRNPYLLLVSPWYTSVFKRPLQRFALRLLFSSHFNIGARLTLRHVVRATTYFLKYVDTLPKHDYITVKYEDLCAEPATCIGNILDFLKLQQRTTLSFERYIRPRPARRLAEITRQYERICQPLQPYLTYLDYTA